MEETRSHLQALRTLVQAGLDENADRIGVERSRQLWQMTLDYGIDYYEFELSWYEKAMKRIHNLPHLTPPIQ
jgi:hypothetical protein